MASTAEIYDAFAKHYRSYSEGKSAYINAVDGLIKKQFAKAPIRLLDYGAGDGVRGAALATEMGAGSLIQADVSDAMLAKCKELGVAKQLVDCKQPDWQQQIASCDAMLCLWNVLGHIPSTEARIETLRSLRDLLARDGYFCFDVNNRHNAAYGTLRVLGRRILDAVLPDYTRGDTSFDWEIDGVKYPAHGHLFTFSEVKHMLQAAGLFMVDWRAVHYQTGQVSKCKTAGQLFFVVRAA